MGSAHVRSLGSVASVEPLDQVPLHLAEPESPGTHQRNRHIDLTYVGIDWMEVIFFATLK